LVETNGNLEFGLLLDKKKMMPFILISGIFL
jgi:hypothetical protein